MSSQNDTAVANPIQPFTPQPNSRLLHKLPGELRNRIYRLAFHTRLTTALVLVKDLTAEDRKPEKNTTTNPSPQLSQPPPTHRLEIVPPLLQTCKQTRHEASEIYYVQRTFELEDSVFQHPCALAKLSAILRPYASQITRLRVLHTFHIGPPKSPGCTPFVCMAFTIARETGSGRLLIEDGFGIRYEGDPAMMQPVFPREARAEPFLHVVPESLGLVCLCPIFRAAEAHGEGDVVSFVGRYVEVLDGRKVDWAETAGDLVFHCWRCAGDEVLLRGRGGV